MDRGSFPRKRWIFRGSVIGKLFALLCWEKALELGTSLYCDGKKHGFISVEEMNEKINPFFRFYLSVGKRGSVAFSPVAFYPG
jgi:hypothetical protein